MKHIITVLVLLFTTHFIHSQNSIVNESALWSTLEIHCMPYGNNYATYHIKFEGDTVINNNDYKTVWKCTNEFLDDWTLNGFIRENENQEVFYMPPGYFEGKVYDFGVSEGDTIETTNFYLNSDTLHFVVTQVDSILLLDGYHKRITLYEYLTEQEEIWVEGLGSWYGILNSCNAAYGAGLCGSYSALCYEYLGELVFQAPEYNTCHYYHVVNSAQIEAEKIKLGPNPANDFVVIDLANIDIAGSNFELELVNLEGKKILRKNLDSNKNVLYLHKVDRGIYIVFIKNLGFNYPPWKLIVD